MSDSTAFRPVSFRKPRRLRAAVAVTALLLAAGCGDRGGDDSAAFDRSEADSLLDYRLVDYAFEGPDTAQGPNVYFTAHNEGTENHELEVLDSSGRALGEIEEFAPGVEPEALALRLEPGEYTLQCILETEDGRIHRDLGMELQLTVS